MSSKTKKDSQIPFEIKRYNLETEQALAEYAEMKNNPEKYKRYDSFDELLDENALVRMEAEAIAKDPNALTFSNVDDLVEELMS